MPLENILKNSNQSGKKPLASDLANGEISLNYHSNGPFLCCKDTAGVVRRIAGTWVGNTPPTAPTPGELWLDTSLAPPQLKTYESSLNGWRPAAATDDGVY